MEIQLDHFKIYEVEAVSAVGHDPTLLGQFEQTAKTVHLGFLRLFATPVSKNGEDILDPNAHLTFYDLQNHPPEPKRVVRLQNQFGEQKLLIGPARYLLAPAHKLEPTLGFPDRLDHFKAYEVLEGDPVNKDVTLKDQFDGVESTVEKPLFFCVPVLKRYQSQIHEIQNPNAHLTIYTIREQDYEHSRGVKDQFLSTDLRFRRAIALAVPSLKLAWEPA